MAKCVLISYAGYPYTLSSLLPDNGLANLAGALLRSGHQVTVLDFGTVGTIRRLIPEGHTEALNGIFKKFGKDVYKKGMGDLARLSDELEEYQKRAVREIGKEIACFIEKERADFAGFKLWNGDGFTGSIALAREIKDRIPGFPVVAGGPHVDMYNRIILEATDAFDILAYGEGEEIIVGLAGYFDGKKDLGRIPNLIYRKGGRTTVTPVKWIDDLDSLPFPVYDEKVYPAMRGDEKIKIIVLDESRGCSNCCFFCMQPIKSGTRIRMKTADRLLEEIKRMAGKHGISCFRFAGSATPPALIGELAGRLLKEGIRIKYTMFARIKESDTAFFRVLRESGCQAVFFGVESGSQRILDKGLGKNVDVDRIRQVLRMSKEAGIFTVASFIFPAPFETEESMRESLDLICQTRPDSVLVQPPGILMGTRWDKEHESFGFEFEKGREHYFRSCLTYKYKLLFPVWLWEPAPFRVNRLAFAEMIGKTEAFTRAVEEAGLLTSCTDELAFISRYTDFRNREKDFRDMCRLWHLGGDHRRISLLVREINRNSADPLYA